jgi:hypothetical protein
MLEYAVQARRIDDHGSLATAKRAEITLDTDAKGREDAMNHSQSHSRSSWVIRINAGSGPRTSSSQ